MQWPWLLLTTINHTTKKDIVDIQNELSVGFVYLVRSIKMIHFIPVSFLDLFAVYVICMGYKNPILDKIDYSFARYS